MGFGSTLKTHFPPHLLLQKFSRDFSQFSTYSMKILENWQRSFGFVVWPEVGRAALTECFVGWRLRGGGRAWSATNFASFSKFSGVYGGRGRQGCTRRVFCRVAAARRRAGTERYKFRQFSKFSGVCGGRGGSEAEHGSGGEGRRAGGGRGGECCEVQVFLGFWRVEGGSPRKTD